MPIRLLPDHIASQIAAGEVIERPSSVVKELVENALDAGSDAITVEVMGAGRRLISVLDNGAGITTDELGLAVSRHATSKLARAEDLFHITTLGFRGEALASIGSVSRMTVESCSKDENIGARLIVEGGRLGQQEDVGVPSGTRIVVEDLFYNVPARLKFLKTDNTERRHIESLVTRYALAYPQIRWQLVVDGKPSLQTSGNGDRREILSALYGVDIAREMLAVDFKEDTYRIHGFISPVSLTRANRREITIFVNGRWVRDTAVTAAVLRAYHTLLMVGRFPIVTLFLDLPPEAVDVNVHPAKAEVRFRENDLVFSRVQRAVRRALLAYSPVPELRPRQFWGGQPESESAEEGQPAWPTAAEIPFPSGDTSESTPARVQIHTVRWMRINCRCSAWWDRWRRPI